MARRRQRLMMGGFGVPLGMGAINAARSPLVGGSAFGNAVNRSLVRGRSPIRPFTPYRPPPVPTGSYDPALDAQVGQATRGLGDLTQDTETGNARDTVDYGLGTDAINRAYTRTSADLGSQMADIRRGYQILGGRQTEAARHQGVISGGLLMMSAAKRAANQTHDLAPVETALSRAGEDRDLSLGQLALDYAPPSADSPLGGRRFQDRTTALTRAERENLNFGLDVNNEKLYQATQAGYVPPSRGQPGGMPRHEGVTATGVPYREVRIGNHIVRYDQHGRVIGRRRAR